jgi:tRNA U34 5-methylaminomethyl-2-thiouridine-forming methyltransferase MnmC
MNVTRTHDPELRMTDDGSMTLFLNSIGESYHSQFGAMNESRHVFIQCGFRFIASRKTSINLLEVGLGTGLNVLLTFLEAEGAGTRVSYTSLEPFPISDSIAERLNYPELVGSENSYQVFKKIHRSGWDTEVLLSETFTFKKLLLPIESYQPGVQVYDLIYFDAFSPVVQPELWTAEIFGKIAGMVSENGALVTYSAKGQVRRNLQEAGFLVERLPGPKGKREILRGVKG